RPLEAEGWLALGFSALRVISWAPSSGPQLLIQKGRPTADDLVPLLSGEADPRMDHLKQWIVNLSPSDRDELDQEQLLAELDGVVTSVAFNPDGTALAGAGQDRVVRLWALDGNQGLTIASHDHWVNSVAFSPDGRLLASSSYDHTIKVTNVS